MMKEKIQSLKVQKKMIKMSKPQSYNKLITSFISMLSQLEDKIFILGLENKNKNNPLLGKNIRK